MEAARGKNDFAVPVADDMGDGSTTCRNHPYRNNLGGICAFCLQEKLRKLVSSSSSFPVLDSPCSSSSPSSPASFTSASSTAHASSLTKTPFSCSSGANPSTRSLNAVDAGDSGARRARIPFLLARRNDNKKKLQPETVLKRSKSGAGPRAGTGRHFLEDESDYSPGTRRTGGGGGFWSFLHLSASSSSSSKSSASRKGEKTLYSFEEESPAINGNGDRFPAFERKVSRSRSVGCGSRSFSGDFFERISTGLGDCTLQRVLSHREVHNSDRNLKQAQRIYKCGGIFGGLMMAAAPSTSPSNWVSSATQGGDHHNNHLQVHRKSSALANGSHSSIRSWNWAFPSPMRAFAKPIKERKREINIIRNGSGRNSAPNLSAIPSLLAVGG